MLCLNNMSFLPFNVSCHQWASDNEGIPFFFSIECTHTYSPPGYSSACVSAIYDDCRLAASCFYSYVQGAMLSPLSGLV